jgi:hypothetical protein
LAEEGTLTLAPRRRHLLIGLGVLVVLAAGTALLLRDDGEVQRVVRPGGGPPSDETVASPTTPDFAFRTTDRKLVRTAGRVGRRDREVGKRASATAAALLTDLYTEAFLDPANWREATYADAFTMFAPGARRHALARAAVLTAGVDAADRFDEILPVGGTLTTRVLLDRSGNPALIDAGVRFAARGTGAEPGTMRSEGRFLFRRQDGAWKVVSFLVTRRDSGAAA